jgi:site-specific recombinase XerD
MKVVELKTMEGKVRYYLTDDAGQPIQPVLKYLKFKDNVGYARNTLRIHCIHLKHFFTYLEKAEKDYEQVNIDDLAGFLGWLKNPDILEKLVPLRFEPEHQPRTINAIIDTTVMFYDYLLRHEGMENHLSEKLVKFVRDPGRNYKSFLRGIAENRMAKSHILKLPVPRMQLRTVSKKDAAVLLDSCTNLREYIPYLCGEITKTGIPLLKIPIRKEVADMVKKLADEAVERSTNDNNPDRYLFNTYMGRCKGLPISKPAFSAAVQELIDRKGILDEDEKPYHFKAHALRHTRAQEYTEQGMPMGIIQQILGHCSLQMTLHYSKVSENMLYRKWKETEKLNLLHLESTPPNVNKEKQEEIRY